MVAEYPLRSLMPQSGSMVLIDDPYDAGEGWAKASVRVGEDSLFYKPGLGVPSWIGVEYMAQTIALYAGFCAAQCGKEISIGLLVGMRRYTVETSFFHLGSELHIEAKEIWLDGQMAVYDCRIKDHADAILAAAELNVFQPGDSITFFAGQKI